MHFSSICAQYKNNYADLLTAQCHDSGVENPDVRDQEAETINNK